MPDMQAVRACNTFVPELRVLLSLEPDRGHGSTDPQFCGCRDLPAPPTNKIRLQLESPRDDRENDAGVRARPHALRPGAVGTSIPWQNGSACLPTVPDKVLKPSNPTP